MTPLAQRVAGICDDALARLAAGPGRDLVERVRDKLAAPLQVTVAGGVSSGKSTLVNALLGQHIAPVDAGECTRVVTEFRYGYDEHAEVRLVGGGTTTLPLDRGRLPSSLGVPPEQVARMVVWLSNARLEHLTIVDTPGLNTVTEVNEANTAEFLGVAGKEGADSAVAIGEADALLFLMPYLREADAKVLAGFRSLYRGSGLSSVNAVGVLSKIDRLTRDGDPLEVARPIAARVAHDLRGLVSEVVPVVGLLAETANAAVFTEDDARAVASVAAVEDELDREDMLLSPEEFLRCDAIDLPEARRRRLLDLLDLYGLELAVAALDAGGRGAAAILRALDDHSGFAPLQDVVRQRFARQADLLKAHAAVCDLRRISWSAPRDDPGNARVLRSLRSPLERVELDPVMHHLRVLEVMQAAALGEVTFADDLLADLERLCSGDDPLARLGVEHTADAPGAARAGAQRWAEWGHDPRRSPDHARLARIVKEAYEVLWVETGGPE